VAYFFGPPCIYRLITDETRTFHPTHRKRSGRSFTRQFPHTTCIRARWGLTMRETM